MRKMQELAQRWMLGTRQGEESRPAWKHPEDLVNLLNQLPGNRTTDHQEKLCSIAWLHDLLEDGVREDGSQVTEEDLLNEGVSPMIVSAVVQLSQQEGEEKVKYLARLKAASKDAKLVKCVDRICNLREGAVTFKDHRWVRYVNETNIYVLPLIEDLDEPEASWLKEQLEQARDARSIKS